MALRKEKQILQPLFDQFSSKKTPPLLYLYGKEPYLIQQAIEWLKDQICPKETRAFNLEILQAKEVSISSILEAAKTLPMLCSSKLVLVYESDKLSSDILNQLLPYIDAPNPNTCLCFIAESADMRLKFFSTFKKYGVILKLDPLSEKDILAFIQTEARHLGITFAQDGIEYLNAQCGNDLGQIHQALQKLSYLHEKGTLISAKDVESFVSGHRALQIFELTDAVCRKSINDSFTALTKLLQDGEPSLRIVALLGRQTRQLLQVKELLSGKQTNHINEIAETLSLSPFVAGKLAQQAKNFSKKELESLHFNIYETEKSIKSSRLDESHYLEQWILTACTA